MIRLETSKRTGIENLQGYEISTFELNWSAEIPKLHPSAIQRTGSSALYNCHGLTFASRRTRVFDTQEVHRILSDDKWLELVIEDVRAGDIVVYYSEEGEANHSGIILECDAEFRLPIVCSKWGHAGEYIHRLSDVPSVYGPQWKFFRCRL
jgi:hypothetical protein